MFSNLLVNARHRFQFNGIPYVIIVALHFGSLYNQGAFCELAFVFGIGFCLEFTSFAYDGLIFEISFCCSVTCILLYIIISLSCFYFFLFFEKIILLLFNYLQCFSLLAKSTDCNISCQLYKFLGPVFILGLFNLLSVNVSSLSCCTHQENPKYTIPTFRHKPSIPVLGCELYMTHFQAFFLLPFVDHLNFDPIT